MTDNADLDPAELEAAGALGGSEDPGYQWPTDPLVVKNLKHWQDLTFGVIVHWGIYSAIGQGGHGPCIATTWVGLPTRRPNSRVTRTMTPVTRTGITIRPRPFGARTLTLPNGPRPVLTPE